MEGVCYREDMGIPAKRRVKLNASPTRFSRPAMHGENSRSTPPCKNGV